MSVTLDQVPVGAPRLVLTRFRAGTFLQEDEAVLMTLMDESGQEPGPTLVAICPIDAVRVDLRARLGLLTVPTPASPRCRRDVHVTRPPTDGVA